MKCYFFLNKLLIHKAYMCKRKCQWHISN